jgi:hypothetical protein
MIKSRYVAASIAQYLHELSARHAEERRDAEERPTVIERPVLAAP